MTRGAVARWRWGDPVEPLRRLLARGGILGVPTESSYALAVDPASETGVRAVLRLKGRPAAKPLPLVVAGLDQLAALGGDLSHPVLRRLAAAWPAPLSLVVPLRRPLAAACGGSTAAFRVPAHPRLVGLLEGVGHGLTATSANRSGEPPILTAAALERLLAGRDAVVVVSGRLRGGRPSTLVTVSGDAAVVLRRGRYPMSRLRRLAQEVRTGEDFSAATVEMSADLRGR